MDIDYNNEIPELKRQNAVTIAIVHSFQDLLETDYDKEIWAKLEKIVQQQEQNYFNKEKTNKE